VQSHRDRGLAWYDSGFGYLRSSVQIRPIPFSFGGIDEDTAFDYMPK
jgi:hypothetical protein